MIVFPIIPSEDVAIIVGRCAVCQALRQDAVEEELSSLFKINFSFGGLYRKYFSSELIISKENSFLIKFIRAPVVPLPVALRLDSPILISRLSELPKVLTSDVLFACPHICNPIDKTESVVNVLR